MNEADTELLPETCPFCHEPVSRPGRRPVPSEHLEQCDAFRAAWESWGDSGSPRA